MFHAWIALVVLAILIVALSIVTIPDPEFKWFTGAITLVLALIASIWFVFKARWGSFQRLFTALDWDTTFFLIGVFILVGGLSEAGWLDKLAVWLSSELGTNNKFPCGMLPQTVEFITN